MKCYIYCNVRLAHSSILTIPDNTVRLKRIGLKKKMLSSKTTTVLSERTVPKIYDASLSHL